ncbi:mRNA N(3)-methylcytidine methyltransferase METTL8 [Huso huso]|uniref:tRNA N(3)-cytidine methyltransferase n=1 Tax=Huso huso TaxID=61971 RepID=A0ABR0ZE85_HUSHU
MKLKSHCTFFQTLSSIAWKRKTGPQCKLWSSDRPNAPLGARILTDPKKVFEHNMWDHVQWSHQEKEDARKKAIENSSVQIPLEERDKYDKEAGKYWDEFYKTHQNKFFKDRNWLFFEFPELLSHRREGFGVEEGQCNVAVPASKNNEMWKKMNTFPGSEATFRIFEVGCGAGNSVFPIVNALKDKSVFLYCCDFSPQAVELVKTHQNYSRVRCHAFVHDVCEEAATFPFPDESLDIILLVFVLSSIHPERMQGVVNRLTQLLKPGGTLLFRDYGRYDLSQLRFKRGRCLSENFYVRGDGTCVYFFTKDEVHNLFSNAGLNEIQNLEDRRLQVNRGKGVVMRRVWMQSKYHKPLAHSDP